MIKPFEFRIAKDPQGQTRIIHGEELEAIRRREEEEKQRYYDSLPKMRFLGLLYRGDYGLYISDAFPARIFIMGGVPSEIVAERGDMMGLTERGYPMPFLRFPEGEELLKRVASHMLFVSQESVT